MTDPLTSSMHDPSREPVPQDADPAAAVQPSVPPAEPRARRRPGPIARLVSLIVSVGLAWALTVAITAWLLGLFLTRG